MRVDNEGKVHVLWTDGTQSEVTPQSLFALPMDVSYELIRFLTELAMILISSLNFLLRRNC